LLVAFDAALVKWRAIAARIGEATAGGDGAALGAVQSVPGISAIGSRSASETSVSRSPASGSCRRGPPP